MKKLLILGLISFLATTAGAGNILFPEGLQFKEMKGKSANPTQRSFVNSMKKIAEADGSAIRPLADGAYGIEGQYVLTINDLYFDNSVGEIKEIVTIEKDVDYYYIVPNDLVNTQFVTEVAFNFDATTNRLRFFPISFGAQNNGTMIVYPLFSPFEWTNNSMVMLDSMSAEFDSATGTISFNEDHGFSWVAYSDANYTKMAGLYNMFDVVNATQSSESLTEDEEQAGQWTYVGKATFVDGWILSSWGYDPQNYPYEVDLQQNVNNKNVYRLWKPYTNVNSPVYYYNKSQYQGQIVFDLTDPQHVLFEAGHPAGYNDSYYNAEFYCFNLLGWQIHGYGGDITDDVYNRIIDYMKNQGQPFDTFDKETGVVRCLVPVFDTEKTCGNPNAWSQVHATLITMPEGWNGVADVAADDDSLPVEYYNLQGILVKEPASGSVLIRRRGSESRKVFIK